MADHRNVSLFDIQAHSEQHFKKSIILPPSTKKFIPTPLVQACLLVITDQQAAQQRGCSQCDAPNDSNIMMVLLNFIVILTKFVQYLCYSMWCNIILLELIILEQLEYLLKAAVKVERALSLHIYNYSN